MAGRWYHKLRTLTENRADVISEFTSLDPGNVAEHFRLAARRMQDARQHLDRGGFPGAVGTDEAQQFAGFHLERKLAHRLDGTIFRLEQGAHRAAHPRGFAFGLEGFLEVGDFNGWHDLFRGKESKVFPGTARQGRCAQPRSVWDLTLVIGGYCSRRGRF